MLIDQILLLLDEIIAADIDVVLVTREFLELNAGDGNSPRKGMAVCMFLDKEGEDFACTIRCGGIGDVIVFVRADILSQICLEVLDQCFNGFVR